MPQRKKRKYTFRKGEVFPYESGSLMHEEVKSRRQAASESAFGSRKKRKRRDSFFWVYE